MKDFIKDYMPLWTAAFAGGFAIGVMTFVWCACRF